MTIKMESRLKEALRHYFFEISVIFVGITLSFLFEEWRTNREEMELVKGHLVEIREEALTIKNVVSIYDSMSTSYH